MTIQVLSKKETKADVAHETSKFTVGAIITMAALISIWAFSCLIGGIASSGVGSLVRGYITAVFGY